MTKQKIKKKPGMTIGEIAECLNEDSKYIVLLIYKNKIIQIDFQEYKSEKLWKTAKEILLYYDGMCKNLRYIKCGMYSKDTYIEFDTKNVNWVKLKEKYYKLNCGDCHE